MKQKNTLKIPLNLSDIKIKQITIDKNEDYHVFVSCTSIETNCNKCGEKITSPHGHSEETIIEHLPLFDNQVFIHVKWPRFKCLKCNDNPTSSFHPDWLNSNGRLTKAFEDYVLKFLINSTVKDVSEKLNTTEETVEGIINRRITTDIKWNQYSPTKIGIDEIALRKGHSHYLTIISDISTSKKIKILGVISGRAKDDIFPFISSIPQKLFNSLESITIDRGASYFSTLKAVINDDELFNRIVTIDRFHVAKLIGTQVDKERKYALKKLKEEYKDDEEVLEKLKYTMWPFRHHPKDLEREEKDRLDDFFGIAPYLKECYDIREELYEIFESNLSKEEAKIQIDAWCLMALDYKTEKLNPFDSFIKTYYNFEENILNYFTHRNSSGPVEGLNNKLKVIKRRGFGFRNVANFTKRLFLDINYRDIFLPKALTC